MQSDIHISVKHYINELYKHLYFTTYMTNSMLLFFTLNDYNSRVCLTTYILNLNNNIYMRGFFNIYLRVKLCQNF